MQTRSYDQYLTRISGMIGTPVSNMTTDELGFLNAYFNNNTRSMWQLNNWPDVCPYGEARFVGNALTYGNVIGNAAWTKSGTTASDNQLSNPLDSRVTAASILETATTAPHYITQTVNQSPATNSTFTAYVRPNGRRYAYLWVVEATSSASHYCIFDLNAGTISTTSALTGDSGAITLIGSGFYQLQLNITSGVMGTAGNTASFRVGVDSTAITDPASSSYLGDVAKGFYVWGANVLQTTNTTPNAFLIPFDQTGESVIDAVFDVFVTNPDGSANPRRVNYQISQNGIQIVTGGGASYSYYGYPQGYGSPPTNPVFVWYRKEPTDYLGAAYSDLTAYSSGATVLYTNSTTSVQDFYTTLTATSAGQSPANTPGNWQINAIPEFLFQYACYAGYADWLRQDGQADKAQLADQMAQKQMDDESDRLERQMGVMLPMKVSSHVTSQARFN